MPTMEASTKTHGVGLSDPQYSSSRRKMLDLVNKLHSTGVQMDLDLPQIAVIGSQSAGKSSLIESISGISLPRAGGTCTRCPTECKLAYSEDAWECSVSLRLIVDEGGNRLDAVRNLPFGSPIVNKAEVEERLRRAQLAILNPSLDPEAFLEGDLDESQGATFSHNYISLHIKGPDVSDLTFVDLPGIIASVKGGGDRQDIEVVRNMVSTHISKPSCIILLTVTCETDFENQGAYDLARTHDPEGMRTVGVLTKPDKIGRGDEARWLRFLQNVEEPLRNGWYSVKQPSTAELDEKIDWVEARRREEAFFTKTKPWSGLDFGIKQRLGTARLTLRLGDILVELIGKRLPELQEEVQRMLSATETALRSLPSPPPEDAMGEVLKLIGEFCRAISRDIDGTPSVDGLIQEVREDYLKFQKAIRSTAPEFKPYPKGDTTSQKSYLNPDFLPDAERVDVSAGPIFYIDEVQERTRRAITRELPDNHPFAVTKEYIASIVKLWEQPALDLLESVERKFSTHVKKTIRQHFDRHSQGGLRQAVAVIASQHLKSCLNATARSMAWLHGLEREPFTLNEHYLTSYKKKFFTLYKQARQAKENQSLMDRMQASASTVHTVVSNLAALGIQCTSSDIPALLPPDPMEHVLRIMAEVRAYYHVAYKRYVDNVPLAIDREFLRGFESGLQQALLAGLSIGGENSQAKCKDLLREASDIGFQRDELERKRLRLQSAKQELLDLWL